MEQLVVACLADNYLVRCVTGQMRTFVAIVVAIAVAEDILIVRCCYEPDKFSKTRQGHMV